MAKVNEFETATDQATARRGKQRYKKDARKHYQYPEEREFTEDLSIIKEYVEHHQEVQRPRLEDLDAYQEGDNTQIFRPGRRKEEHLADNRAAHNFAQYISTFIQGHMTGIPVKTEYVAREEDLKDVSDEDDRETIKNDAKSIDRELQVLNRKNEADEHNSTLVLDMSVFGRAYELVWRNKDNNVRFVRLDPKCTFVVYDTSVERNPVAGVYYVPNFDNESKLDITVYTPDFVVTYTTDTKNEAGIEEVKRESNSVKYVQIIEYENNNKRMGDYESVLTLIDLYDSAQSDLANYSQDLNDAMLLIEGNAKLDLSQAKEMKKANTMILKPATAPNGQVGAVTGKYIYKQYDVAGTEAYKSRIQEDIFLISNVPNLLDDSFAGTQSGEALKMKLFGLTQKIATKERKFKKALRMRYHIIRRLTSLASELDFDVENLQITFTENLPKAISQELEWFHKLGGRLSQETMLSLLSFVENPREEMAKIKAEKEEAEPVQPDFVRYLRGEGEEDESTIGRTSVDNRVDSEIADVE